MVPHQGEHPRRQQNPTGKGLPSYSPELLRLEPRLHAVFSCVGRAVSGSGFRV